LENQKIVKLNYHEFISIGYYIDGDFYHHSVNDEPASIWLIDDKSHEWYKDGKRHRTTGPAIISDNGDIWWYVDDINITPKVQKWCIHNNIGEKSLSQSDIEVMLFEIQLDNED